VISRNVDTFTSAQVIPRLYAIRKFILISTQVRHCELTRPISIQFTLQ